MDDVYKAHEWLASHWSEAEKFTGKWIAVTGSGIVASSNSFKSLASQKIVDERKALITKVPTVEESNAIWVL